MSNIINSSIEFIKKRFEGDSSGHDFYHSLRVYNLATEIARSERADLKIVQLASLLHDVDDKKLFHQNTVIDCSRSFLLEHKVSTSEIDMICQIIQEVSFKGNESVKPSTMEGMIVQDADRLDALGAIGVARTFAYGGSRGRKLHDPCEAPKLDMTADEYYNTIGTSINHFYEKLLKLKDIMNTVEGKKIAEYRHQFILNFLEEFYLEWQGKK